MWHAAKLDSGRSPDYRALVELTGAHVLTSAWLLALAVTLGLAARRRSLLPVLAVGPIVGVAWIVLAAHEGNTVTREDQVVLIAACILGSCLAVIPIAYVRWVRRVFRDASQHVRSI